MSIGESLLDKYNKNVLDNIEKYYYPNSKKIIFQSLKIIGKYFKYGKFEKIPGSYDAIQFSVTPEDYKIEAIAGMNY